MQNPAGGAIALSLGLALAAAVAPARAQGRDSTPPAPDLLIMAELLPGIYDNANQHYFDRRRGLPEADRHARVSTTITRTEGCDYIGIMLQSVTWHVPNEAGGRFNRDLLVLYAMEKLPDGSVTEHGYTFAEPDATRIGHNLKWLLVNCATTPRAEARPEM